jgi:glycosyltransferase involved in cell wall biosynthesis
MFNSTRTDRRFSARAKAALGISVGLFHRYDAGPVSLLYPTSDAAAPQTGLRFSIVTPSFNQGQFIGETIESVLQQNYKSFQYIVQDADSKDDTCRVVTSYKDPRLLANFEKDNGQADALNRGFGQTHGEILGYLNSDDLLMPGALSHVAEYFASHPDVDAVYGDRLIIDESSHVVGHWRLPPHDPAVISIVDYVPQETLFWRRSLWERVGARFDDSLSFAMDWDLILRFQSAGAKIVHLPIFLGAFRVHLSQKTHAAIGTGRSEMQIVRSRYVGRFKALFFQFAHLRYLWRHVRIDRASPGGQTKYVR